MHSLNAKSWKNTKATAKQLNHSLVCARTMAVTAISPSTLCSGVQLLSPCLHPIPEGSSFPGGQTAAGRQGFEGGTCLVPACSCFLLPGLPRKAWGQNWMWRIRAGLWGRSSQCPATPILDSRSSEIQGHDPTTSSFLHLLGEHLRGPELEKEVKEVAGPGATVALFPPL